MAFLRRYPYRLATLVAAVAAILWLWHAFAPLLLIDHAPSVFGARAGAFSLNITGRLAWRATAATWRLDEGPAQPLHSAPPRVAPPSFVIEIAAEGLKPGPHRLMIEATAPLRFSERREFVFRYEPMPPAATLIRRWQPSEELDVQDGVFQRLRAADGSWWVRPVPGFEGWDRTIVASGAFSGARRVTTRLIFRYAANDRGRFGFGLFPLWGGRPEEGDHRPARGWRFGLVWYYGALQAIGVGFSERIGNRLPVWVTNYRDFSLEPGRRYLLRSEAWPEAGGHGHRRWWLRAKWWPEDSPEPEAWLVVSDDQGSPLPDLPYGVALFAHYAQVEFGETVVEPLPPPYPNGPLAPWPES
jgi:hypothetical protein